MEYIDLNKCLEWRILQHFGSAVVGRLAKRHGGQRTRTQPPSLVLEFENNLAFLEMELRSVARWRFSRTVPQTAYFDIKPKLQSLCVVLDNIVNWSLMERQKEDATQPSTTPYSSFRALLSYLDDDSESANISTIDMVKGPNSTLFVGRDENEVREALRVASECNETFVYLQKTESLAQHDMTSSHLESAWSANTSTMLYFQERTNKVLDAVFESSSSCTNVHEPILLYLPNEGEEPQAATPTLHMFLPCCSLPGVWQQAKCVPYNSDTFHVERMPDICFLLKNWPRTKLLQILHEHQGLFYGLIDIPPMATLLVDAEQSLWRHIQRGALLRGDQDVQRPPDFCTPKEKQIMALKLARCLQAFFDSEATLPSWDSQNVYLITPPEGKPADRLLFLPFGKRDSHSSGFTIRFAHPVLLAFAKLLLEIDLGIPIDLSEHDEPTKQWGALCELLYNSVRGGSGLFAEAIDGVLYLHREWQRIRLRSQDEDPLVLLRRLMQQTVVSHLELVLKPPTASEGKDQRKQYENDHISGGGGARNYSLSRTSPSLASTGAMLSDHSVEVQDNNSTTPSLHEMPNAVHRAARKPPVVHMKNKKVTVFRAREVLLKDKLLISDAVKEIIHSNVSNNDRAWIRFAVRDITKSDINRFDSQHNRRGTALVIFRSPLPEQLKEVTKSRENCCAFSNGKDGEERLSMDLDSHFFGATQLYEPPSTTNVVADIVAIHGLNGHPYGSWVSKSANPQMWLTDFLPEDIKNCRIIIYGYNSNILEERDHSRHELYTQAERLRTTLGNIRNNDELKRRPLFFLAHSYGGLVLARALIEDKMRQVQLLGATTALFLFGCPYRGFYTEDIIGMINAELEASGRDHISNDKASELVRRLGEGDFRTELASYPDVVFGKKVYSFIESNKTPTVTRKTGTNRRDGPPVLAAGANSVVLGLPSTIEEVILTDKDHSNMVKFESRTDQTYEDVKCRIEAEIERLRVSPRVASKSVSAF